MVCYWSIPLSCHFRETQTESDCQLTGASADFHLRYRELRKREPRGYQQSIAEQEKHNRAIHLWTILPLLHQAETG